MLPRSMSRSTAPGPAPGLSSAWSTALAAGSIGTLPSAPAYAANPVTPGNFTRPRLRPVRGAEPAAR